jgi:hypothetical protein
MAWDGIVAAVLADYQWALKQRDDEPLPDSDPLIECAN